MLTNLVERYLMRPKRLREAIQAVVHDRWYGWTYNSNAKRYYFDDIGNESLMGLWEDQWAREKEVVKSSLFENQVDFE